MFDLDREIARWCASFRVGESSAWVDELADHLYSAVQAHKAAGLSSEDAFRAALEDMGDRSMLQTELKKNRSWLARLCAAERRWLHVPQTASIQRAAKRMLIGNAILWAAAQLAVAWLTAGSETSAYTSSVLTLLWLGSTMVIRSALRDIGRDAELA
ncbi:MAG: permease prefix domain 1-containing protein [Myxococcota bacterium]